MSAPQDESAVPEVRFKRRKIAHKKRAPTQDEAVTALVSKSPEAELIDNAPTLLNPDEDDAESVANLQEMIRNRRRPRDRFKESARKPEPHSTEIVPVEAPRADQYTSRFVAQTGQIVDRDDKQMTEYVEARMAEQNYRQYGWPIPRHLQIAVAAIAPDLKHTFTGGTSAHKTAHGSESVTDVQHSQRQAAGQGKLQEVDLGPDVAARIEKDWKRLDAGEPEEESTSKARKSKYGYQWRRAKRRNSDAERRDKMVEAVLKEAKLDFFDDTVPTNPRFQASGTNNDDEVAERFRAEYFEAMEEQQHRKAPPPASGAKGAKEASKGPKLGGSKSARAKMRLQEEQAAKAKR